MSHYFIAIPIPKHLRKILLNWQQTCQNVLPYKQWTHKDDFHITLKFLGSVDDEQLCILKHELHQLQDFPKFSVNIGALNTFGNKNSPRVLWIGVEKTKYIVRLHQLIDELVNRYLGFPRDTRNYQPHITLGKRWIGHQTLDNQLAHLAKEINKKYVLNVDEIVLYQITPSHQPKYSVVKKFPLNGGGNNRSIN